ncbi:MAG: hypothetical protein C0606_00430 [Hyphomicrobiales bacterium]|nr:MAG: hypothetical protein C0606_00430 [Hyphomicrobiales bacterium]
MGESWGKGAVRSGALHKDWSCRDARARFSKGVAPAPEVAAMSFSIADFEKLARNAGPDRSAALLRACAELYASEDKHTERERRLFQSIVYDLFGTCGSDGKRVLADLVAAHPETPKPVLRLLYREPIDIARQVILRSPQLDELEMLRIANLGGAHLQTLAERPDLPLLALQAIVMADDLGAIGALIGNRSVSLEPVPFEKLLQAVTRNHRLGDQLALRPDIAGERLVEIFLDLGRAGRERVVAAVEHKLLGASVGRKPIPVTTKVSGNGHYPLYKAIYSRDRELLLSLLAQEFDLRRTLVERILDDATGEPIAVLLKASGIPTDRAIAAFSDIIPTLAQSSDKVRSLTRFFDRLSVKAALYLIDQWRISDQPAMRVPPHLVSPVHKLAAAESQRRLKAQVTQPTGDADNDRGKSPKKVDAA